jgi:hypothetical protein
MKPLKIVIAVAAALGFIAVFLPYFSIGDKSMSLWDFHNIKDPHGTQGILNGPKQAYVALVMFGVPAVLAGLAFAQKRLSRGLAIGATVFFLLSFAVEGVRKGISENQGVSTAIGGKLLFFAALIGLVGAIVGIVKPEPRTA